MSRLRPIALLLALALCLLAPAVAQADHNQLSVFQDDDNLIYRDTATVNHTLGVLESLGVQYVRVTVKWKLLAPDPESRTRPANFNARDPAAYPAGAWFPYDRVLLLAAEHHIGVQFLLTIPGPVWAMSPRPLLKRLADRWGPIPHEYGAFVAAAGARYSGAYQTPGGTIPRVSTWAIWNEPNQPGWLSPQARKLHGRWIPVSPWLYRMYVGAAYNALQATGHTPRSDTILIGELAPEGLTDLGWFYAMPPLRFLRGLYCVDNSFRPLRGQYAAEVGCPTRGSPAAFRRANLGLFYANGFSHHPYYFYHPPWEGALVPDFVPMANLGRLERWLNRTLAVYGVHRRMPLYLTEYGYRTNPPNPYQVVSPAQQAQYLNQADYMAWRDPRVRSVAQFLLVDALPNSNFPSSSFDYWGTFQTGLVFADGRPKPAFWAYRMPIWIPFPSIPRRGRLYIWGQLRPASWVAASRRQVVGIEWKGYGRRARWHTIAAAVVKALGAYYQVYTRLPGSGFVHAAWLSGNATVIHSRVVAVTVR